MSIWNWLTHVWVTPWLALLLYWLPAGCAAVYFLMSTIGEYKKEMHVRRDAIEKGYNFSSEITVGLLLWRVFACACPVINIFTTVFYFTPRFFSGFFEALGRFLSISLLPSYSPPPRKNDETHK